MSKKNKPSDKLDLSTLNGDQLRAFEQLLAYIKNPDDDEIYVLKGWAGTGKTYCISFLVRYILTVVHPSKSWYKVAVTGPTNKSVRVIKKSSGMVNSRVTFQTIHKLLGLTEHINNRGEQEFLNKSGLKPNINSMKILVIDEVSMLNDDLFLQIIKYRGRLKIICMGDPAQIPPVGKPDCIPFREELADEYRITTLELSKIMRQKEDNPIIDISVKIRSNLGSHEFPCPPITKINDKGEGIEFLNLNSSEVRSGFNHLLSKYFKTDRFERDSEYCKIIAWRNSTVSSMNDLVRNVIYGEKSKESKILIGEKLIADEPIIKDDTVIITTNEEITVIDYEIRSEYLSYKVDDDPDSDNFSVDIKYYESKVFYLDDQNDKVENKIKILHEESQSDFNQLTLLLKQRAIENKGKDNSWIKYYDVMRRYANVKYSYAITGHKSQGSTYDTSFVLDDDIDTNRNVVERNRIKYTSYTRSSKKLYVLKRF
jgi:exodeoxyribonuclease-5